MKIMLADGGRLADPYTLQAWEEDFELPKTPRGRSRRQSKRLNPEAVEEEDNASSEDQAKDDHKDIQKDAKDKADIEEAKGESDSTDTKHETANVQDDQAEIGPTNVETEDQAKDEPEDVTTVLDDKPETELTETRCQTSGHGVEVDTVIEVKGGAPTVTVSWEKDEQPEEPESVAEDLTRTHDTEIAKDEQVEMTSTDIQEEEEMEDEEEEEKTQTTEVVLVEESEEEPAEAEEKDDEIEIIEDPNPNKETEAAEDKDDVEMGSSASEDDVCQKTEQEGERDREEEEEEDKEATTKVSGKRKAESSIDSSPSKKVKVINDGYCLYVGNLDSSKYYTEIRSALEIYFMTQSVLVQDIRLDKAKKHAFIDLVSEIDLTKALKLNGQKLLNKPLKIAKAIVKEVDLVKKKKDPQKSRNERTIHVQNIPSSATRQDVLNVFPKATAVRFLGGTENPSKGVAFVEFQSKDQADAARAQSGTVMMKDCVLRVNMVRESSGVHKTKGASKNNTKDNVPPSNTLFVSNLPLKVQTKDLKKIFKNAVQINIPQSEGKSRGYAFVEFESVKLAQKALKASKNGVISKRPLKVQFGLKSQTEQTRVPSKSLIVLGLHEKTTAETLTEAFEGALSSRIFVNKDTGQSRKFGFVDFESADSCAWAKEAAEGIQINGRKVTVAFARPKQLQSPDTGEREEHKGGKKGKRRGAGQPSQKKTEVAHQN